MPLPKKAYKASNPCATIWRKISNQVLMEMRFNDSNNNIDAALPRRRLLQNAATNPFNVQTLKA